MILSLFKVDTFHLRNPWFHVLKPMLSDRNLMPFSKHYPCPLKLYIYAKMAGLIDNDIF